MSISNIFILIKFIIGFAVGFLIYKTVKIYYVRRKYRHLPGPDTQGIFGFYIGNIVDIDRVIKSGKLYSDFLIECHNIYGEVFKYQFFDEIIVCTTNKHAIKEILIVKNYPKTKNFINIGAFPQNLRFLGYGLVTDPDNLRWKHRRSLFNPGFHRSVLISFVDHFNTKADTLMERLRTLADGKTVVSLFTELNHTTLDAIAYIAFGMNIDSINRKDPDLSNALSGVLKILEKTIIDPLFRFRPSSWNEYKNLKSYLKYIRNAGREKIMERINALKSREHVPNDILSSIIKNWKDEDMDLEALVDDFVTFLVAGQETTANTLAFTFLELGKNKDIFFKAREEIDTILGEKNEINYQNAVELKYCSCIFKEALRIYPPLATINRQILDDLVINGYKIPKMTNMDLPPCVSGKLEKYFANPLEFKPERFLKDRDNSDNLTLENYTYYPFSLGPRNCIGQNFAQIEAVILIAKFIQKFDFDLDPYQSFAVDSALTLRPKDGTKCILKLRS